MTRYEPGRSVGHGLEVLPLFAVAMIALSGCDEPDEGLELLGPGEVHVETLGPVEMPAVERASGEPAEVEWAVVDPRIAQVVDGRVVAEHEGRTTVTGRVGEDAIEVVLVVEPQLLLVFEAPPESLVVGDTARLVVRARKGKTLIEAERVSFRSSDPAVLDVSSAGEATAVASGVAYVTAEGHGSETMVQITIP